MTIFEPKVFLDYQWSNMSKSDQDWEANLNKKKKGGAPKPRRRAKPALRFRQEAPQAGGALRLFVEIAVFSRLREVKGLFW